MIDIEIIKRTYADLPDEKLIALVRTDGTEIVYEAFILLKKEYAKRKLDPAIITEIEERRQETSKLKIKENLEREDAMINEKIWRELFRQKAEGKRKDEMIEWLIKNGVEPEAAIDGIGRLDNVAKASYQQSRKAMIVSFVFIGLGIASFVVLLSEPKMIQYAWLSSLPIITALKFLPANHKFFRLCERTMNAIEQEEASKE